MVSFLMIFIQSMGESLSCLPDDSNYLSIYIYYGFVMVLQSKGFVDSEDKKKAVVEAINNALLMKE